MAMSLAGEQVRLPFFVIPADNAVGSEKAGAEASIVGTRMRAREGMPLARAPTISTRK
jgi:hypothetical protein